MFALVRRSEAKHGRALSLQARAEGAYLGLAVGDALGATVEFMTPREIQSMYGVHDAIIGGGWLRLKPGYVTDDTTMSLALGRSIIEQNGFDAESMAKAFDGWMRAKPVDIGNTVRRGILHFRNSGDPKNPESEYDAGNGACMRSLPIALATFNTPELRYEASRAQAHVTHNNPLSDAACDCVIDIVHAALQGRSLQEIFDAQVTDLVDRFPKFDYRGQRSETPSGYVVETLVAVFQALHDHDSFEFAMIDVVNRGGDADTTGAILGMIAGALYGVEAIPRRWMNRLDKDTKKACIEQARTLVGRAE